MYACGGGEHGDCRLGRDRARWRLPESTHRARVPTVRTRPPDARGDLYAAERHCAAIAHAAECAHDPALIVLLAPRHRPVLARPRRARVRTAVARADDLAPRHGRGGVDNAPYDALEAPLLALRALCEEVM
ncbi:hypothetical protein EVG20_g10058 [Dentipellis fragilis]|uniref:Uncharacterized protein n=1 Tax=Dentipellis fragilis TaxID=205917 RepID=A0A4Y9XUY1_9AGAM|nr:hypothetical protein EVG20_g10058 [Dentipellis fragilis]